MQRILTSLLLVVALFACQKTNDTAPAPTPTAGFSFTLASNGEVNFTNTSQNATGYSWDFGDNTPKVTDKSPAMCIA